MESGATEALSLFSTNPRTAPRQLPHTASAYERLDRAPGEPAQRVRNLLDEWWRRLPAQARPQVRGRFMRSHLAEHLGAFFEMYLHEAFCRLDFSVAADIGADEQPGRRPDFHIAADATALQVEATAVLGDDAIDRKDRARVQQLYDAIERIGNRDFLLNLQLLSVGPNTPGKKLIAAVDRWLDSLDYEVELKKKQSNGERQSSVISVDGWSMNVTADPWKPSVRGRADLGVIGSKEEGFGDFDLDSQDLEFGLAPIDETMPLKEALRRKARHGYELQDKPFVVAALCAGEFIDDRDIAMALLGEIRYTVGGGGTGHYTGGGLWLDDQCRPRNRDISGVLTVVDLRPRSSALAKPCLWVNPWAKHSVPAELFPWRRMEIQPDGQTIERDATRSAADILGLDPQWPGVS